MRQLAVSLSLGLVLLSGCDIHKNIVQPDQTRGPGSNPPPPQAAQLVAYMNENARKVQAVQSMSVSIDCKVDNKSVGLDAKLVCEKPRFFRLKGQVLGKPQVDFGSNDNEFWYWIAQDNPPAVYHCSYQDMSTGKVNLPFPFQPDMVISAMGLAEYDPGKNYDVKVVGQTVELSEAAVTPAGRPVRKVTVFSRFETKAPKPQVIAHIIKDESGKDICAATIQEVVLDRASNAILPQKIHLKWPEQRMEMTMRMRDVQSVKLDTAQTNRMFSRADLSKFPNYDLARMRLAQPQGVSQVNPSLQQAGGDPNAWRR